MSPASVAVPYIMLVSFLTPVLYEPDVLTVQSLNDSPFHGVAVMMKDVYSTKHVHEYQYVRSALYLKRRCKKDVWPWIFFNRIVGYREGDESSPTASTTPAGIPFSSIKGMDIYNEEGALEDLYHTWKTALRVARHLRSPGIVIDTEAYNNYLTGDLPYVAHLCEKPSEEVRRRLEQIGAELVDAAEATYPEAILWFLATDLGRPRRPRTVAAYTSFRSYHSSAAHIIIGMLNRAKEQESRLVFVTGGQAGLGYCHHSLDSMKQKIRERFERFRPKLDKHPNLRFGGTIALWDRAESKTGYWVTNEECRTAGMQSIEDFKPLLSELISRYPFVWLYASNSLWNPYERRSTVTFERVLRDVLTSARKESYTPVRSGAVDRLRFSFTRHRIKEMGHVETQMEHRR